ncbi:MAG: prepilin-type N-terminal cleavage/methylation domain-containing protein [Planctomycetota bacterium]
MTGFTLVEVVLVIVVIGALAAITVPLYQDRDQDSKINTMRGVVRTVRWRVQVYHSETGSYPATLDPAWFTSPLANVFSDSANQDQVFTASHSLWLYPSNKTFVASSGFSMWYNAGNGSFCVRVPPQSDSAASMELFNRVNMGNVSSMAQRL